MSTTKDVPTTIITITITTPKDNRSNRMDNYRQKKSNYMLTPRMVEGMGSSGQLQMDSEYHRMKKAYDKLTLDEKMKVGKLPEKFTVDNDGSYGIGTGMTTIIASNPDGCVVQ